MSALAIDLRAFLKENIRSVGELDVLLFLKRHANQDWDAANIAVTLQIEQAKASHILMRLYLQGLLHQERVEGPLYQYRYLPFPRSQDKKISALAAAFELARADILERDLNAFADAFSFRKREDGK